MKRRDGEKNNDDNDLKNIRFSDLRTTGMILKEIENELIPQTVSKTGKLSDKVLLGDWIPWHYGTEQIEKPQKSKFKSINFLIERTISRKRHEKVII